MDLVLDQRDRRALSDVLALLTSPLTTSSAEEWKGQVLEAIQPLFDSDGGAFVLPHEGEPPVTLRNRPMQYLDEYLEHQHLDLGGDYYAVGGGVMCTAAANAFHGYDFVDSELYDLLYAKYQIRESVSAVLDVTDHPIVVDSSRVFAPRGVPVEGMLVQYTDRPGNPRFGAEGMELMRFLRPVLRSAAQSWKDLANRRESLTVIVDDSAEPMAVYASSGKLVHRNRAMSQLLRSGVAQGNLEPVSRELAIEVGDVARLDAESIARAGSFSREIPVGSDLYRLTATRVDAIVGMPGAVLIRAQRTSHRSLDIRRLRRRFTLTEREAEVAVLLARGKSNRSIAKLLRISEHTTRRHTERVLAKLRIQSRSQVAFRLAPDGALDIVD